MKPDAITRYAQGDIIGFLQDHYYVKVKGKGWVPIQLEPWQIEYILKPLFYDLDADGRRKYDVALLGMPKKNGKSSLGAGIGIYFMHCDEEGGEIIIGANAKDQASLIIYSTMRDAIKHDRRLRSDTGLYRTYMEVRSTGTVCRAIAHQYDSAAGLNPNLTLFDELWGFTDRKFYDELTTVPTRINPLTVIVTYAGFAQEGLLWELYSDGIAGDTLLETPRKEIHIKRGLNDPRMFMFWSHENLASWITPEYLAAQRRRLPTPSYMRLHENRWVSHIGTVITQSEVGKLLDPNWKYQFAPRLEKGYKYIMATDLGLSDDRTAVAIVHFEPEDQKVYLDNLRLWQGSPEEHVLIEDVEQYMMQEAERFQVYSIVCDPWQMEHAIQRMKGIYRAKPFNFATDMVNLSRVVLNLVRSQTLTLYEGCDELTDEFKSAILKQTARGFKLEHTTKSKNDCIVTVGMAALEAVQSQYFEPKIYY